MAKYIATILTSFLFTSAYADVLKDFDSLGGNDVLVERARQLKPDKEISVVQKRIVDRRWRNEFSFGYSNTLGGDAYNQTQSLGLNYHLHISPRWAVGASYFSSFNQLSKEARYLIDVDNQIPDIDAPKDGYEIVGNFYPIYGKINMFDMGVLHFDFYALLSYGNISLASGDTGQFSVGGGLGLWVSQHLTTRFELRQRFYQAQRFNGAADMEVTVASISMGVLL